MPLSHAARFLEDQLVIHVQGGGFPRDRGRRCRASVVVGCQPHAGSSPIQVGLKSGYPTARIPSSARRMAPAASTSRCRRR